MVQGPTLYSGIYFWPLPTGLVRHLLAVGAEHVGVVVSGVLAARQVEGHVEEDDDGEEHAEDESGCFLLSDQLRV